jgi:hypothetical protein
MRKFLICILASVVPAVMLLSACVAPVITPEPTLTPTPAPVKPTSVSQPSQLKPPQVFEMNVKGVPSIGWLDPQTAKEELERGTLRFEVEAGNRVEGEVTLTLYLFSKPDVPVSTNIEPIFVNIRDPYENIILQSSRYKTPKGSELSNQKYPWRFSFIASTTGDFSLQVLMLGLLQDGVYEAHLKVTAYEK